MTTLRRFIRAIVAADQHPDRDQLLPAVMDVQRMKAAGEQFTWQISAELLKREYGERTRSKTSSGTEFGPLGEVVALLRDQLQSAGEQLKVKDQQIASQVEIIHSLNDRIHEGNVLMATVQKQLALAEPEKPTDAPVVKPAKAVEKHATPKRPARKGFLARLFR
ncbi:MAG: hypothetical protein SFV23_13825 [Planctomycetaceae bacterium]|nr:hypothetical protein [Planctomycetaceae bacterium]